jgi:hypothetical protein
VNARRVGDVMAGKVIMLEKNDGLFVGAGERDQRAKTTGIWGLLVFE